MVVTSALTLPFLDVPGYIPFPALGLDDEAAGAWVSPSSGAAVVSPVPYAVVVSVCAAVVDGASDLPPHAANDNTITDAIANDSILFFTRLSSSFLFITYASLYLHTFDTANTQIIESS